MNEKPKILIVDDEPNMVASLNIVLREEAGYEVITSLSGEEALNKMDLSVDVALVDINMPGMDGLTLLRELKKLKPDLPVIMITAYSSIKSAVKALKNGAFDYITKPFEIDDLLENIEKAVQQVKQKEEAKLPQSSWVSARPVIIGRSPQIKKVIQLINTAAKADSNVLITGESGTGKELVAQALHTGSRRKNKPFVSVNCAAIPDNLLESELFGYKRGAFTGADRSKKGLFQQANGGTLFLDEIGDMHPEMQTKLLRVVETKEVFPVGGTEPEQVDVRIVCATNKDLTKEVERGRFREDLFFRINVFHIHVPALRERREDIPYLIDHFLKVKSYELKMPKKRISREALKALMDYDYPGNVRELEHIIENAYLLADENQEICPHHLRFTGMSRGSDDGIFSGDLTGAYQKLKQRFRHLEERLIREAVLRYPHLSNEELAKILGTTRRVLELRMKEFGISKKEVHRKETEGDLT